MHIVEEARNNKPCVGIIAAINDDSSELILRNVPSRILVAI